MSRGDAAVSRISAVLRAEYLLPIACVAGAACLAAAEFSTIFEFNRGTSGEPLKTIEASDRHYYALLVLAVFAFVATVVAVLAGSRPAAAAVAVAGVLSLLIFLLVDLPDVNQEGSLDDPTFEFFASRAEPAGGFWLELIGTVTLAVAGGALATLRPEQLQMLAPARFRAGAGREARDGGVAPTDRTRPREAGAASRGKTPKPASETPARTTAGRRRERAR